MLLDMEENSLDSDVVPYAELDAPTLDAGDVRKTEEHSGELRFTEEFFKKIKIWLPPELKQEHADLLIVYNVEHDKPDAERLKDVVNAMEFPLETGGTIAAKAFLHNDPAMCGWISSHVDWLGYALKYSTLICVLYTNEFFREPPIKQMADASLWESVNQHHRENDFIPVFLTNPRSQNFPYALSPYCKLRRSLKMYNDGWEDNIRAAVWHCLKSRLEREENQRREQIAYIRIHHPELLPADVSSGLSTNSDTSTQTNENYSATDSLTLAASGPQPQYDHNSEQNLDAHANDQYSTNTDDVGAVSRVEPDGSCQTEAAAAAATAAAGCSAVNPAKAAADSCDAATSRSIQITEVFLYAATFGIIFSMFFHYRQT